MNNNVKQFKIILDDVSSNLLNQFIERFKKNNKHLKINVSTCTSWIVKNFLTNYIEKEEANFINDHFDQKKYLTDLIRRSSSKNLFDTVGIEIKRFSRAKSHKTRPEPELNISDETSLGEANE